MLMTLLPEYSSCIRLRRVSKAVKNEVDAVFQARKETYVTTIRYIKKQLNELWTRTPNSYMPYQYHVMYYRRRRRRRLKHVSMGAYYAFPGWEIWGTCGYMALKISFRPHKVAVKLVHPPNTTYVCTMVNVEHDMERLFSRAKAPWIRENIMQLAGR
jgi:hypothetical protein